MADRDIKYLSKDFSTFKQNLQEFSKNYFPNTYSDFTDASPGSLFVEMASYVGDVLGYYVDTQLQENFLLYTKEKENILSLAQSLGYKPKMATAASVDLDIFQIVPASGSAGNKVPDYRYGMVLKENSEISTTGGTNVSFNTIQDIDFKISSSFDPTTVSVYSTSGGDVNYFLLKKKVKAISLGNRKTVDFTIGNAEKFKKLTLSDTGITEITSCTDSDGNVWYEVPTLGQETVFQTVENNSLNDPTLSGDSDSTPYLLKVVKTPRRFTTRFVNDNTLEIEFGSGILDEDDQEIIPNITNVGLNLPQGKDKLDLAFDPSNFVSTKSYGLAPSNTTLTFIYYAGAGVSSNVPSNTLTSGNNLIIEQPSFIGENSDTKALVRNSITFNNPSPARGGKDGDTLEEIRINALSSLSTQKRAVTKEDYIIRTLNMPSKYGAVSKAYITKDEILNKQSADTNPFALNLYVLGYDNNKNLSTLNTATKENLKTYLSQYRMVTDSINIRDAFIINIGIKFDLVVLPNFNSQEVLSRCISALQDYFDVDKWQINQPIVIGDIMFVLTSIKGVQNVQNIQIENKYGIANGYSRFIYDIESATSNNVVYPPLDPTIFEIKNPNTDITGRIVRY
jgi:hypothetical protein